MEKHHITKLKHLTGFQGKKLAHVGFDPELDHYFFVFEDKSTISMPGDELVIHQEGSSLFEAYMDQYGLFAEQVVKLKEVLQGPPVSAAEETMPPSEQTHEVDSVTKLAVVEAAAEAAKVANDFDLMQAAQPMEESASPEPSVEG